MTNVIRTSQLGAFFVNWHPAATGRQQTYTLVGIENGSSLLAQFMVADVSVFYS